METKPIVIICLLLALACSANQSLAKQYPEPNVPDLLIRSDLVMLGSVSEVRGENGALRTSLSVEKVLKGAASEAGYIIDLGESKRAVPALPRHGVFFLNSVKGRLIPTRPDLPYLLAPSDEWQLQSPSVDALSQVAASLASVYRLSPDLIQGRRSGVISTLMLVRSPSARGSEKLSDLNWMVPSPLRQAEEVYRITTDELRSIPYNLRRGYLIELLSSGLHFPQSIWVASSMIEAGDLSATKSIEAYLLHPPKEMSLTSVGIMLALQRCPPTDGLSSFADYLLASDNLYLKKGAISALLNLPSDVDISNLSLALQDQNSEIREGAVSLACERTLQCGGNWTGLASLSNVPIMTAMWTKWNLNKTSHN